MPWTNDQTFVSGFLVFLYDTWWWPIRVETYFELNIKTFVCVTATPLIIYSVRISTIVACRPVVRQRPRKTNNYFQQMELLPTTTCFGIYVSSSGTIFYIIYNDFHNRIQQRYQSFLQVVLPKFRAHLSFSHVFYMPCPSHLIWLDFSNTVWKEMQIIKFLIIQFWVNNDVVKIIRKKSKQPTYLL
jgi:hypothetical protein